MGNGGEGGGGEGEGKRRGRRRETAQVPPFLPSSLPPLPQPSPPPSVQISPPSELPSSPTLLTPSPPLPRPSTPVQVLEESEFDSITPPQHTRSTSQPRLTLPFISSISFFSMTRPRASSFDSEMQSPHTLQGGEWAEGDGGGEGGGKEGGTVKEKFNKIWVGMTGGETKGKHSRPTSSHLPPAPALAGEGSGRGETGGRGKKGGRTKRRNSDSQTHYSVETLSHPPPSPPNASTLPPDLTSSPPLCHPLHLHYWAPPSKAKAPTRRGSLDSLTLIPGSQPPHLKKYSVKGSFDRLVVQRLITAGSGWGAVGGGRGAAGEVKEVKRSFMATLTDRQHSHPAGEFAHTLTAAPTLSPSTSTPALPSSSPSSLSPSLLLLLAHRAASSHPSLLTRLSSSPTSLLCRPVTKFIASSIGGREGPRWGLLVDGVEVEGVSVVSVNAQVSGRVRALIVHTFAGKEDRTA